MDGRFGCGMWHVRAARRVDRTSHVPHFFRRPDKDLVCWKTTTQKNIPHGSSISREDWITYPQNIGSPPCTKMPQRGAPYIVSSSALKNTHKHRSIARDILPRKSQKERQEKKSHSSQLSQRLQQEKMDCGILRCWEDVFPTVGEEEEVASRRSVTSTTAVKDQSSSDPATAPMMESSQSFSALFPSMTMVNTDDYERLQQHRIDLLEQLESSLDEIKRLQTQSNLYRLEVEKLRDERQRVREALEGRDGYF